MPSWQVAKPSPETRRDGRRLRDHRQRVRTCQARRLIREYDQVAFGYATSGTDRRHTASEPCEQIGRDRRVSIRPLARQPAVRRSCCHWRRALPAYYVITDAQTVSVWDFQGTVAPDIEVVNMRQSELAERFDRFTLA